MKKFFNLLLLLVLFFACRKKDTGPTPKTVDDITTVTASIQGVVVNENDVPVMGATVTVGTNTAITNAYGIFEFRNKDISKNNTHIKVTKAGYFKGNRSMIATASRTHQVRIKLQPKSVIGNINAAIGGVFTIASGCKVTFPANAIVDAIGNAYAGTVVVTMAYISPTATDLASTLQGDLRGIATDGSEKVLETYGMLGVELTNLAGQPLKIANGKSAEIASPIPATLQASAPTTIPLWHFDEVKGRWLEEGTASKVGNTYVGTVSHFSFWNYDIGANSVTLCVNLVTVNNQPLANTLVRIRRTGNIASLSYGFTDGLGNVCGLVFQNEPLTLEVLDRCGGVVHTQNIGPFNANANITVNVTITTSNSITITGNVTNCNNVPVTNGAVFITTNNGYSYNASVNASGNFSLIILNCINNVFNFTALPIDYLTLQQGIPVGNSVSIGTINLGSLQACGTNSLEFINTLIGGIPYIWSRPRDSLWSNFGGNTFPYFTTTSMSANTPNVGFALPGIQTIFGHNITPGTYSIFRSTVLVYLPNNTSVMSQQISSLAPVINLTAIGPSITGFIEGNYNIDMLFHTDNVVRNVQCYFRIRRP